MTEADWRHPRAHSLGMLINGEATDETDARGRPIEGDTLLLLINGGDAAITFDLPAQDIPGHWEKLVDTCEADQRGASVGSVNLEANSLVLLRYQRSAAQ
jgi:glycogen operon protein